MLEFIIYSEKNSLIFEISDENDISKEFIFNLLRIFGEYDDQNKSIKLGLFKLEQGHKDNLEILTKHYQSSNIKINQLNQFIKSIPNNEYCLIYPKQESNIELTSKTVGFIKFLNKGLSLDEAILKANQEWEQINSLFNNIMNDYSIKPFIMKKKYYSGPKSKDQRVCRYCGKTINSGATFNEIAHTIPESIGNKLLFTNDECDSCNNKFSSTLDQDIFEYFKLYRVSYGKKGKKGIPKLKFQNYGELKYENNQAEILSQNIIEKSEQGEFIVNLQNKETLNVSNIYRSFCKFALGLVDEKLLHHFVETINWINNIKNDGTVYKLPIISAHLDNKYNDQPTLMLYLRNTKNYKKPYMFAELRIVQFIIVYIIPYCDEDTVDFSVEENYQFFWNHCNHYTSLPNWTKHDFNLDKDLKINFNIKFVKDESLKN